MEKEKLNIGLFIDTFFPMIDGVINVVDNYAKRLNKIANVTVFAPYTKKTFDDSLLPYKVVRSKRLKLIGLDYDLPLPQFDKEFKKAIYQANLDIIHIHSPFSIGKMAANYGRKHNIPVVATMHSQFKKDFKKATKSEQIANLLIKKIMKVFNSVDECWAVNKNIGDIFIEYGYKKIPLVYNNGTDLLPLKNKKEINEEINKKFNIKPDEKVLMFVGRMVVLKNILFIAEALKVLKEKGYEFKMLYIGSGSDEDILRTRIKELGLENNVILCGRISDRDEIAKLFSRAHLFLFPSLYDASSLVQIEAASQKTPTIFLKGAATAGTVTNDVNGFIVENSVQAFADKIAETIDKKEYYEKVSNGAFKDLYVTWDQMTEKVYNSYLELIKAKGAKYE